MDEAFLTIKPRAKGHLMSSWTADIIQKVKQSVRENSAVSSRKTGFTFIAMKFKPK